MADPNSVLCYDAPFPLYGVAFSHSPSHPTRIALTSFLSSSSNKIQIIESPSSTTSSSSSTSYSPFGAAPAGAQDFRVLATTSHAYPATKVAFSPAPTTLHKNGELLATTGDVLRIWSLEEDDGEGEYGMGDTGGWRGGELGWRLGERNKLTNSKSPTSNLPPLTSFSWNPQNPTSIVTASVDTTATIWDIETGQAVTQLIAHDSAVNDISWLPQSNDVFVSVGADGSLRAFDLRSLEHSTILYESAGSRPLARISFSPIAQHYLTTFGLDDENAIVLDMRSPGAPVAELRGHGGALGAVGWGLGTRAGTGGGGWIATCGDDAQLLLYDLTSPLPFPASTSTPSLKPASNQPSRSPTPAPTRTPNIQPSMAWNASAEINNLAWGSEGSGLIGSVSGRRVTCLRV